MVLVPVFRILWVLLSLISVQARSQECDADGTCSSSSSGSSRSFSTAQSCDVRPSSADACRVPSSLYDGGGTAVAYRPHAPESSTICEPVNYTSTMYRPAGWAWSRSVYTNKQQGAPQLWLKFHLLGCASLAPDSCCCHALPPSTTTTKVEVWQARPDGSYSSLRDHDAVGDCRASQRTSSTGSFVVFETVAPGSVGSLGGLGGRDSMPYGPPVIHAMIQAQGYASILVDLPISIDMTTYQQAFFFGPDLRGAAWVRRPNDAHYRIRDWRGDPDTNRIEIEVDILLPQQTTSTASSRTELCPSFVYGLPSSFFFEPIAVCAPSMLNFFAL